MFSRKCLNPSGKMISENKKIFLSFTCFRNVCEVNLPMGKRSNWWWQVLMVCASASRISSETRNTCLNKMCAMATQI
ncbi:hypothetical protein XELAEV_18000089mg [Xenopus laevis]|uniref:Uncharacterized protein n=1 Tax=Xenopus laevis TaxID=8355 RepID=A0A974BP36_XENLA|nr:hypothetical protein XELAEV_18000089mg [Xenopus laevis]